MGGDTPAFYLKIIMSNVDANTRGRYKFVGGNTEVVRGSTFAVGHRFQGQNGNKAKANVVAHGVIVSLAGGTLHGRLEEGNVSMSVSSIEPGVESVLLYEGNNDNDLPMVRLGNALNSTTKWPMEALKAIPEE